MPNPQSDYIKDMKTVAIGLVTWGVPRLIAGDSTGNLIGLALLLPLVNYMHNIGQERRIGSNLMNAAAQTFSSSSEANRLWAYNAYRNVSNGGAKMFDDLANGFAQEAGHMQAAIKDAERTNNINVISRDRNLSTSPVGNQREFRDFDHLKNTVSGAIDGQKLAAAADMLGNTIKNRLKQ